MQKQVGEESKLKKNSYLILRFHVGVGVFHPYLGHIGVSFMRYCTSSNLLGVWGTHRCHGYAKQLTLKEFETFYECWFSQCANRNILFESTNGGE